MAQRQPRLSGEAAKLARELAHKPTADLVRRINGQLPDYAPHILGTLSVQQQVERRLSLNRYGKIVLAVPGVGHEPAVAQERRPMVPLEMAKMLNKAKQPAEPIIAKDLPFYVIDYGKPILPTGVMRAWGAASSPAVRVDMMQRGMSIRTAEVSSIAHSGVYDQIHRTGDTSVVAKHANKLLATLTTIPHRRIRWDSQDAATSTQYALRQMPLSNNDEQTTVLVESQVFGRAVETGALFGDVRQTNTHYNSPGRVFTLYGQTTFAIDPDLVAGLTSDLPIGTTVAVNDSDIQALEEFITEKDTSVLAPAYTDFIMGQQLLAAG